MIQTCRLAFLVFVFWQSPSNVNNNNNRQPCASATVQKCQCGCELAGGEEASPLPDLMHYSHVDLLLVYHGIVQSCSAVTLCVLHFVGGFSTHYTINLLVPALGAFSLPEAEVLFTSIQTEAKPRFV